MLNPTKLGIMSLPLLLASLSQPVQAATQEGTILILNKENSQCALPVPGEGTGKLVQHELNLFDSDCLSIKPRKIKFDGLPSAAQILITDGLGCDMKEDDASVSDTHTFWLKLRTTKRMASSDWYELEDLASYNKDEIISPGLQMLDKKVKQSSLIRDKASCIRITTSSAMPPPTPVPAKQNKKTEYEDVKPNDDFLCGLNEVMTGRAHKGDETYGRSTYTCATFKQGFKDLLLADNVWSEKVTESAGSYFMCPPGTVMSGRSHEGDENGKTKYYCGKLKNGSKTLNVVWSDGWSSPQNENSSDYTCPINSFLVGRYHVGDENRPTRYRCATAY